MVGVENKAMVLGLSVNGLTGKFNLGFGCGPIYRDTNATCSREPRAQSMSERDRPRAGEPLELALGCDRLRVQHNRVGFDSAASFRWANKGVDTRSA